MKLIEIIQERIDLELYEHQMGASPDGILSFWLSLKTWWRSRPRLLPCLHCGQSVWYNKTYAEGPYCCEQCAYYGPARDMPDDEIPF